MAHECTPMSSRPSIKSLEIDDRLHKCISKIKYHNNPNKILVNDYLSLRIQNVCNVDMKSNILDLMETQIHLLLIE